MRKPALNPCEKVAQRIQNRMRALMPQIVRVKGDERQRRIGFVDGMAYALRYVNREAKRMKAKGD